MLLHRATRLVLGWNSLGTVWSANVHMWSCALLRDFLFLLGQVCGTLPQECSNAPLWEPDVASPPCPPSVFLWSSCFTAEIECCLLSVSQVESPDSMGSVTIITVNCTRNCRRKKKDQDAAFAPCYNLGWEWGKEAKGDAVFPLRTCSPRWLLTATPEWGSLYGPYTTSALTVSPRLHHPCGLAEVWTAAVQAP